MQIPEEIKPLIDAARPYVSDINAIIHLLARAYELGEAKKAKNDA